MQNVVGKEDRHYTSSVQEKVSRILFRDPGQENRKTTTLKWRKEDTLCSWHYQNRQIEPGRLQRYEYKVHNVI